MKRTHKQTLSSVPLGFQTWLAGILVLMSVCTCHCVFSKEYMVILWKKQTHFPLRSISTPTDSLSKKLSSLPNLLFQCLGAFHQQHKTSWTHLGPAFSFLDSFLWLLADPLRPLLRFLRYIRDRSELFFIFLDDALKMQKSVHFSLSGVNVRIFLE